MKNIILLVFTTVVIFGCKSVRKPTQLKEVGSRGWHTTVAPVAEFDTRHKSVEIWTPKNVKNAPVVIYAHGGAGFREDDRARIDMLQRNGFATISFDSYEMNGLDWNFVTRRVTNNGKQNLIWGVFEGALKYALKENEKWDVNNIFLYGASNGGRTVLYAGGEFSVKNIRGIISEAPAATGYALGDVNIPTIILYGAMDNWAGKSETDYVWTRTYTNSPISVEDWLKSQQEKSHPIKFILYENAGHLLFEGPLEKVTVKRGDKIAFTAYQGADNQVLRLYERDLIEFINNNLDDAK
jgi:dienelactone hydrolase